MTYMNTVGIIVWQKLFWGQYFVFDTQTNDIIIPASDNKIIFHLSDSRFTHKSKLTNCGSNYPPKLFFEASSENKK